MTIHLCFHGIGTCTTEREPGESRYWVSEDLFLRVLDRLTGERDVELSFDDGNVSDIEVAVPALRERGMLATFFVLAGRLDDPTSLSSSDLRELRESDMRVGSHGWAHTPWRGLTPVEEQQEFVDARIVLEEASGSAVTSAALPLGRYDRACLRGVKKAGYQALYTSDRFRARPSSWLQARYSVMADDSVESVMRIVRGGPGFREARNLAASAAKRLR